MTCPFKRNSSGLRKPSAYGDFFLQGVCIFHAAEADTNPKCKRGHNSRPRLRIGLVCRDQYGERQEKVAPTLRGGNGSCHGVNRIPKISRAALAPVTRLEPGLAQIIHGRLIQEAACRM